MNGIPNTKSLARSPGQGSMTLRKPFTRKRSAVLQMRERGLRTILVLCEQADDKADAVLLNVYKIPC
jgi:hypothetical protein